MKSRPIAAAFFVVFCLLLCGLILRRQITAHPRTPQMAGQFSGSQPGFMNIPGWHAASPALTKQVHDLIQAQLLAMRNGDSAKAMSYQSVLLRRSFTTPDQFLQMINEQYPEFGHNRTVQCGPVVTDKSQQQIQAFVQVEGEDGRVVRGNFRLMREDGQLKVAGVQTQQL